jgi:hypothetical protein
MMMMMMMMMTEIILETSVQYRHLTGLTAREDFIDTVSLPPGSQYLDVCKKWQLIGSFSALSSLSQFLYLHLTTFIFEKKCSQIYVPSKRLVIRRAWPLSAGNLSANK